METAEYALNARAIKSFIRRNGRAPNNSEKQRLYRQMQSQYPNLDKPGFADTDLTRPQFLQEASAEVENFNREALVDDINMIGKNINILNQRLEQSYRGFYANLNQMHQALDKEEERLNRLLVQSSSVDPFIHGVEETFDNPDKIDWLQTDAEVSIGNVTLGRTGLRTVDLRKTEIHASVLNEAASLGQGANSQVMSLAEEDGSIYQVIAYSTKQQKSVTLVLDIDLKQVFDIQNVDLLGLPIEVGKHAYVSLFYTKDGSSYIPLEPVELPWKATTSFQMGISGVRKIQIRIRKSAADIMEARGRFATFFSLDAIKVYIDDYTSALESILVSGPYEILNSEDRPVNFTQATLQCCTVEPQGTGIDWFLSGDGITWLAVDPSKKNLWQASLGNGSMELNSQLIDTEALPGKILGKSDTSALELSADEAVINQYMNLAAHQIDNRTLILKRHLPGKESGWVVDPRTRRLKTVVYVAAPEGRWIDLGSSGAYLQGTRITGEVFLPQGYLRFETDDQNWFDIPNGLTYEQLKEQDPLYPYNHKLLMEGYKLPAVLPGYPYRGLERHFGILCEYIPPEKFYAQGTTEHFTTLDINNNKYVIIKVDKSNTKWADELTELQWVTEGKADNKIWVKAILRSDNRKYSPIIQNYNVRVI